MQDKKQVVAISSIIGIIIAGICTVAHNSGIIP